MKRTLLLTTAVRLLLVSCQQHHDRNIYKADVIIYGGTSSAVTAAVEVARMGKSVIIVSPDKHLSYENIKTKLEAAGQILK
jgi:ribulose 1,5-bisphosphate synthetase/thiazole synthase